MTAKGVHRISSRGGPNFFRYKPGGGENRSGGGEKKFYMKGFYVRAKRAKIFSPPPGQFLTINVPIIRDVDPD